MAATGTAFDIGRPFAYVFEDKNWMGKVLIGGLVLIGSLITTPLLLLGLLGFCMVGGYMRRVALQVADGTELPIPELMAQPGEDIMNGLKMMLINIVWVLPAILLRIVGIVAMLVLSAASGGGDDASAAGGFVMIGTSCLAFPLQILGSVIGFVGIIRFMDTGELGAGFRVGEIWAFLKRSWVNVLLVLVVGMGAGIAAEIVGFIALCIGIFFTMFWAYLVGAHGVGQLIRIDRATRAAG